LAEFQLQPGARVGDERKAVETMLDDHAEVARQAVDLRVKVGHREGDVVNSWGDHRFLQDTCRIPQDIGVVSSAGWLLDEGWGRASRDAK
jgi:hypothetical protein